MSVEDRKRRAATAITPEFIIANAEGRVGGPTWTRDVAEEWLSATAGGWGLYVSIDAYDALAGIAQSEAVAEVIAAARALSDHRLQRALARLDEAPRIA